MIAFDSSNIIFQTAASFINQTGKHLFLTGKAGTGKTTFLKYIREHSSKKMAVVAPTGVAAINAGGVTIHSFLQIPPGIYLPQKTAFEGFDGRTYSNHSLFKQMRMSADKKQLLRELDLLVIDEISMVRADLLDAVDAVLRHVRRQPVPFGGVQMLYIGDLFQLPPVAVTDEWDLLKDHYRSPFFFDAHVIQRFPPIYIELKKIYRQKDDVFIRILNNIRNNCCTEADLDRLHEHYDPGFSPSPKEKFITLTTHNDKAAAINNEELRKLPDRLYDFKAETTGAFNNRAYPAQESLLLKKGAQVMFIKNDSGEFRRYYNGKIGFVHRVDEKEIQIAFPGETTILTVEKETWKNITYHYHKEKDKIEEEQLGTFTQYPIRLAWAITIHKSQGLTFERAIIDAGASFAAGQVYVALSRLTSLDGLVIKSPIYQHCIHTDERVLEFAGMELPEDALKQILQKEQQDYMEYSLLKTFGWEKMIELLDEHLKSYEHRNLPNTEACITWTEELREKTKIIQKTAFKFQQQMEGLFRQVEGSDYRQCSERISAACNFFIREIEEKLLPSLNDHIETMRIKKKTRKYLKQVLELKYRMERKKVELLNALNVAKILKESENGFDMSRAADTLQTPIVIDTSEGRQISKTKPVKGETRRISLELFRKGKSIEAIAEERGLAYSTVEGHLAGFVSSGEINVLQMVDKVKLDKISRLLQTHPGYSASQLRQQLGEECSYGQIKAVIGYLSTTM